MRSLCILLLATSVLGGHAFQALSTKASTTSTRLSLSSTLTPELEKLTAAFESIGDDKLRHKQLLYMANQMPAMDKSLMVLDNKVPGCLSTVFVHGTTRTQVRDDGSGEVTVVDFTGDSDGLLTKGLVAFLIRGFSGLTPEEIVAIDPAFIARAGLTTSLTPGRNNGFLNMVAKMKQIAEQLSTATTTTEEETTQSTPEASTEDVEEKSSASSPAFEPTGRPMYDAIVQALQTLQPTSLELVDVSYQHAGHAGMNGVEADESHFELTVVAEAFDGLNLVKRHQLIYMLLGQVMPQIHALQIRANTPSEVEQKS